MAFSKCDMSFTTSVSSINQLILAFYIPNQLCMAASYEDVQLNISHAVALRIKENHTVRQESCPVLNLGIVIM